MGWWDLLLLDTKENANLKRADVNQPKEGVPREKLLQKLDKKKGEEW